MSPGKSPQIAPERHNAPAMALQEPSLKGRALRLLGMREYSRAEIERRLKDHAPEPGLLARTLDELEAKGFINAQRVIDSVIHRRAGKLGAARIQHELQNKGLDAAMVLDAVARLQATELGRARAVWQKKFGGTQADDSAAGAAGASARSRQMRFLASRGFDGDTIRRVVSQSSDEQDPMPG